MGTMTRIILFSALSLYLVLAVIISTAFETTYNNNLISSESKSVTNSDANFDLAVHLNIKYFWLDFCLIYAEFIIWIIILITFFFTNN